MPELLEIERYRSAAGSVVGRTIESVHAPDAWYCKGGADPRVLADVLTGGRVTAARRHGKLLMLDVDIGRQTHDEVVLGLRFGMTGRLVIDGEAAIDRLEYSSARIDPVWERFAMSFVGGGSLSVIDPRRLGGVELDPERDRLGPDAASLTTDGLRAALASRRPLKAALLDQGRVAGLGNLLVDESLWRAGLDPAREASSLSDDELGQLSFAVHETLTELDARGGSHRGDLHPQRHRAGRCPRDGAALLRRTIGGRTTYSCPLHQR